MMESAFNALYIHAITVHQSSRSCDTHLTELQASQTVAILVDPGAIETEAHHVGYHQ